MNCPTGYRVRTDPVTAAEQPEGSPARGAADRAKRLLAEITKGKWFLQPDDLIGGWCVMNVDKPPSQANRIANGDRSIADFVLRADAEFIAAAPDLVADLLAEHKYLGRLVDAYIEVNARLTAELAGLREQIAQDVRAKLGITSRALPIILGGSS